MSLDTLISPGYAKIWGITGGQYGTSWETRIADNLLESYDAIPISIPASFSLKQFDYKAEEEIINPVADTVATATYMDRR